MNLKLKIAANTTAQIIGKIVSAGATFLITILLARKYGPDGFGDFEKITSFVALFYLVVDFGLNAVAISEIKKQPEKKRDWYGLVLGTRIVLGTLLIFLCLAILSFLPAGSQGLPGSETQGFTPFVRLGIIIASVTIFLQGLTISNNLLFQESLRYDKSVIASSLGYVLFLFLTILVINLNLSLLFVILSFVAFFLLYTLVSFLLAKSMVLSIKPVFAKKEIANLLKKSLPLGITLIFNVIYFRSDIILLSFLKPTSHVAYYGLAYRFFEVALVFPTFFVNALYPILLEAKNKTKENLKNIFFTSAGFLLAVGLMAGATLFIFAPLLIGLTSSSFQESILSLRLLSLSLPIFYLTNLLMWFLIAYEKQKLLAPIYGLTMVINVALNLFFIPYYSYLASSIITGLTELLILLLLVFFIRRELNQIRQV